MTRRREYPGWAFSNHLQESGWLPPIEEDGGMSPGTNPYCSLRMNQWLQFDWSSGGYHYYGSYCWGEI